MDQENYIPVFDSKRTKKNKKVKRTIFYDECEIYPYQFLLSRIPFSKTEIQKITLPIPKIKLFPKKTKFENFENYSKIFKRVPNHFSEFLFSELSTFGSICDEALFLKGRFRQSQIESVIQKYKNLFVQCHICCSWETEIKQKKILKCKKCFSSKIIKN